MANRNRNRPPQSERGRQPQQHDWDREPYRQQEQYQRGMDEQQGESRSEYRDYRQPRQYDRGQGGSAFSESRYGDPSTSYSQNRDYDPLGDYDRASYSVRQDEYGPDRATHSYFRADDFGGEDYSADISRGYGTRPSRMSGYAGGQRGSGGGYGGDTGRGFFDRMGDEVSSWFGDEEAARRRRMDHRGSGPANYKRSDERLLEDACERLTHDRWVDAKNINVTVSDNEVTLDGTVDSRQTKRRAEDCIDEITGVKHVQNNLRVVETGSKYEAMNNSADES